MNLRIAARFLAVLLLVTCAVCALSAAAADNLLAPEQAFRFSARLIEPGLVEVRYRIADGYYMYRDKFRFTAIPQSAGLGEAQFPPGKIKDDEFFGRVETYRGELVIRLPVKSAGGFTLRAVSQGCADVGVCYIPVTQTAQLVPARSSGETIISAGNGSNLLSRSQDAAPSR
ncbi:MAG TPA: protein-disulfide reductase DsbD N-terminal domain-containing protein [Burkholderiales bacterium]|jgi:thiol:disulfide interchange protein DsbD|nr:protein-disulfide reductase DsbD N-terminal domain-containing protein [Burkholderiales bacterium]